MALEFDHLFIVTEIDAPAVEQLAVFGLTEGQPNVHPGQGTACRRIFFHNAMLELLWLRDAAEARSEIIAPTRLWERSRHRDSGYAPFGLCLRPTGDDPSKTAFATWPYRPPYLPPHLHIEVADNDAYPAEPMIFCIPFGGRPDRYPPEKQPPLNHPIGFKEITALTLTLAPLATKSAALRAIEADGIISSINGSAPLAELFFDNAATGHIADFRPVLPLVFHW